MHRSVFFTLFLLILGACVPTEKEREIETPEIDSYETAVLFDSTGMVIDSVSISVPEEAPEMIVKLDCRLVSPADADNPRYEVALLAMDQRIPLDTVHACQNFTNEDFAANEIPRRAISACGGWYQGVGEYFYLTEDNQDLVVNYAWLKEEQTTNRYPYREVYRLKLPQLER